MFIIAAVDSAKIRAKKIYFLVEPIREKYVLHFACYNSFAIITQPDIYSFAWFKMTE